MIHRIHILGASGSGTTTLGRALAGVSSVRTLIQTTTSGYRLTHPIPISENVPSVSNSSWTMSQLMTPGSYQGRFCGWGDVAIPRLSWSSTWGFPTIYGWNVFVVESMHGLVSASSLVGTCTSLPKRFLRGQRHMMREVWTSAADGSMKVAWDTAQSHPLL